HAFADDRRRRTDDREPTLLPFLSSVDRRPSSTSYGNDRGERPPRRRQACPAPRWRARPTGWPASELRRPSARAQPCALPPVAPPRPCRQRRDRSPAPPRPAPPAPPTFS